MITYYKNMKTIIPIFLLFFSIELKGQSFISKDSLLDNKKILPKDIAKTLKTVGAYRFAASYNFENNNFDIQNSKPYSFIIFDGISVNFMTEKDLSKKMEKCEFKVKYKIQGNNIIFTGPSEIDKFVVIKLTSKFMVLEEISNGKPYTRDLYIP